MEFLGWNTIVPKFIYTTNEHLKILYEMAKLVLILLKTDVDIIRPNKWLASKTTVFYTFLWYK